jgi:hypothetical protein
MKTGWFVIPFLAVLFVPLVQPTPGLVELAARQGIRLHEGNDQTVFLYTFTRNGEKKNTVVVTAGASLQVDASADSASCISLSVAMPFNLGDGAVLKISLGDDQRLQPAVDLSLDPVHVRADRRWIPLQFPIPAGLKSVRLKFEAEPGRRNDFTGDWIGLAAGPDASCLFGKASIGE